MGVKVVIIARRKVVNAHRSADYKGSNNILRSKYIHNPTSYQRNATDPLLSPAIIYLQGEYKLLLNLHFWGDSTRCIWVPTLIYKS